jgi:deazaflavin-dependent oxidoreductase (nitroreductase family)
MSEPNYKSPDLDLVGADHVKRYRETDGEVGYIWNGVTALLLTTTGRRTGTPRTSALIFGRHEGNYLVVASQGGAPTHPNWYLNLLETPNAEIQVRGEHLPVVARTASPEEKPQLWKVMTDLWPNYDVYQTRTDRSIPLVVLTPSN